MKSLNTTDHVTAEVVVKASEEFVNILQRALKPEVDRPSSDRSRVRIEVQDGNFMLDIKASDVSALRATLNSYLRWCDSVMRILEKVS